MNQKLLIVVLVALASVIVAQAAPWTGLYDAAKNALVNKVVSGAISRLEMSSYYKQTLDRVKKRYEEAKTNGELDGKNEAEQLDIYYRIVIEEMKTLKDKLEAEAPKKPAAEFDEALLEEGFDENSQGINGDEHDEDLELELLQQLEDLEKQEAEMGWSLSEESRAALKARTQEVVKDLMSNELRQLALTVVTTYATGGGSSGYAIITSGAAQALKLKLVQYLMNCVMEIISSMMGTKITLTPAQAA